MPDRRSRIESTFKNSFPYWVSFILLIWAIRVNEFSQFESPFMDYSWNHFFPGLFYDLWSALISIGILSLFQVVLAVFSERLALWFFHLMALILVAIHAGISQYFLLMQTPLDSSIYFLGWNDLSRIINISNYVNTPVIIIALTGVIVYFSLPLLLKRVTVPSRIILISLLLLSALTAPFSIYTSEDAGKTMMLNNHFSYFVNESITYFRNANYLHQRPKVSSADFKELDPRFLNSSGTFDADYPLLHSLETEGNFADQFNLDPKRPPHIVVIIIESLNSYFVNEQSDMYVGIMPFLSSLAKRSVFFPNTLSTSGRTLNVLPSTMASLPIASDYISPMDLDPFPVQYALPSLLKQHYFSRFYCGVDLSYSNMNGFMNHNQTSYLVRNWETRFKKRDDYYDDGDLFQKSWVDLKKGMTKGKNRLDVFLTYNTHEPFNYPDKSAYGDRVLKFMKNSKLSSWIRTRIDENSEKFGSYTYLDDQLKAYFTEAEKHPEHKNTIYFIVGDHGSELCYFEPASRYHTSLIVYSELLKQPKVSKSVISHLDLPPTIIQLLKPYKSLNLPDQVPFSGSPISITNTFSSDRFFPLKHNNLSLCGMIFGDLFYDRGMLYRFKDDLKTTPVNDPALVRKIQRQMDLYRLMSNYCLKQNQLIPYSIARNYIRVNNLIPFYYLIKRNKQKDFNNGEFIELGKAPSIPQSNNVLQLTFEIEIDGKELTTRRDLPELVYNFIEKKAEGDKVLCYKGIKPVLRKPFRSSGVNKLYYSTIVQLNNFERTEKTVFNYYLYNHAKKELKLKKYTVNIKSDRPSTR